MATRSPSTGRTVWVRLTDIPITRRVAVAERIARTERMVATDAIALKMAAINPRENPGLWVDVSDAARVGVDLDAKGVTA